MGSEAATLRVEDSMFDANAVRVPLDASGVDYRCTLDGNEQYDDAEGILELWRRVAERPRSWPGPWAVGCILCFNLAQLRSRVI